MRTLKNNYFKLLASHKRITTDPLRIQGLQVLRASGAIEIENSLCFRWNAAQNRFDIIQRAWLQGKKAYTDTVIAHAAPNEEVEFLLTASGTSLRGHLRTSERVMPQAFSVGYTSPSVPLHLNALRPERPAVRFVPAVVIYQK